MVNLGLTETVELAKSAANINTIYPVGIVVWFAQNKNPNALFPGTTWKYIGENKTIRLASMSGSNVLSSGGSDSITLSAAQLPVHNHSFSATTSSFDYGTKTTNTTGNHYHTVNGMGRPGDIRPKVSTTSGGSYTFENPDTNSAGNHNHIVAIGAHNHLVSGATGNTGNSSAINVANAYVMLMGWYRSA
ncbi:phage tail protein [Photorhabdus hindustanensis]|uniref:Phage tail protein n=1 Tax=Photorhabdus hindustanensis TaxID=2918802 RepID=A0A2S8PUL0_9GAMM|nr:phage tail protein [Photorhabdus hindustanensis]